MIHIISQRLALPSLTGIYTLTTRGDDYKSLLANAVIQEELPSGEVETDYAMEEAEEAVWKAAHELIESALIR